MAKKKAARRSKRQRPKSPGGQPLKQPPKALRTEFPVLEDFYAQHWGPVPDRNAYGVYALGLYCNSADYLELASDAITEGFDDKDVDLCHIDSEIGHAYIAQCYLSETWGKSTAPTNKADDLLTGLSWLLNDAIDDVPEKLRKRARELQDGLRAGDVTHLHLLFIHNGRDSESVKATLRTVRSSAATLVQNDSVSISTMEIGLTHLQHLYDSSTKLIIVEQRMEFEAPDQIRESGDGWKAIATTISGGVLHSLYQEHGEELFSANIRGFLDMLRRKTSINRGILETIQRDPTRFWAFNNGVTILTKRFRPKNGKVTVQGLSIINGAQTTGVLGRAPKDSASKVRVPCRIIECSDDHLIEQIIESNNTQNAIKAFDFRSNDPTQVALRGEFQKFGIDYMHRRQGATRMAASAIQAEVVATHLAAFHGNFQIATRQRRTIFEDRSTYGDVFPRSICAEHVYLVQCLADAVAHFKLQLQHSVDAESANPTQVAMAEFLGYSTAKLFVVAVIGNLAPNILSRALPNSFAWVAASRFMQPDRGPLVERWKILVEALVPLMVSQSGDDLYEVVRSTSGVAKVVESVSFLLESLKKQLAESFSPIRDVSDIR